MASLRHARVVEYSNAPLHCPINQFPSPVLVCSFVVVWSENSTTLKRCDFFFILNSILAHRTGLYICLFRDLFFPQDKETICSLPELIKENILDYLLGHERSFSGSCTRERTPVPNPAFKQTQVLCALLPPPRCPAPDSHENTWRGHKCILEKSPSPPLKSGQQQKLWSLGAWHY